jgi:hypothetical protein
MAAVPFQQYDPGGLYMERILGYEPGMGMAQPTMFSTPGVQTSPQLPGGIRGLRFAKVTAGPTGTAGAAAGVMSGAQILGAIWFVTMPALTTGLTFVIHATDDGTNAADLGLNALFAIQCKIVVANALLNFGVPNYATTTPFLSPGGGAGINAVGPEQSAVLTLGATAGMFASVTIPVTNAQLGTGAAAGSIVMCRVRRVGVAATDTLPGSVIVTGINVANT